MQRGDARRESSLQAAFFKRAGQRARLAREQAAARARAGPRGFCRPLRRFSASGGLVGHGRSGADERSKARRPAKGVKAGALGAPLAQAGAAPGCFAGGLRLARQPAQERGCEERLPRQATRLGACDCEGRG